MGLIFGVIADIFACIVFEFMLYVTGSIIIRMVTFGANKAPILSYAKFKILKKLDEPGYTAAVITGMCFYVSIIVIAVFVYSN